MDMGARKSTKINFLLLPRACPRRHRRRFQPRVFQWRPLVENGPKQVQNAADPTLFVKRRALNTSCELRQLFKQLNASSKLWWLTRRKIRAEGPTSESDLKAFWWRQTGNIQLSLCRVRREESDSIFFYYQKMLEDGFQQQKLKMKLFSSYIKKGYQNIFSL